MERLQPAEYAPLNPDAMQAIQTVVTRAARDGMQLVIDIHNYGAGFGHPIGSPETPDRAFADLWRKLAQRFSGDRNVIFGLMNEPHMQTPAAWLPAVNAAIASIRGAGATHQESWYPAQIGMEPGRGYRLATPPQSAVALSIPMAILLLRCISISTRMDQGHIPRWYRRPSDPTVLPLSPIGRQSYGASFSWVSLGWQPDAPSLDALRNMLEFMRKHPVWQGGAFWSGGAWWHDYPFSIEPDARPIQAANGDFLKRRVQEMIGQAMTPRLARAKAVRQDQRRTISRPDTKHGAAF